jgi:hypothetical protein
MHHSSMQYRIVERRLQAQGCTWKPGKGDHIKWFCPCGKHIAVLTRGVVSAGVVADTVEKLSCLPKGWLD